MLMLPRHFGLFFGRTLWRSNLCGSWSVPALMARGHAVEVFKTNVNGPGTCAVPIGIPVTLDGARIRYFPCSGECGVDIAQIRKRALHSLPQTRVTVVPIAVAALATRFCDSGLLEGI